MSTQTLGNIIPCFGGLVFFALLFGFIALMRYFSYRETVALAEKGLIRPAPASGNGQGTLRWGVVIASLGLALSVGLYPIGFMFDSSSLRFPLHFGPWMLFGLIPLFFGLGLILVYVVTRETKKRPEPDKTETNVP